MRMPNTPPVITTTSPVSVGENQTAVDTLEATDPDDDPITGWSITSGADDSLFNLTDDGLLTFHTAPDYENPTDAGGDNSYTFEVTASDGTADSAPLTLTVNVTDISEPPHAPNRRDGVGQQREPDDGSRRELGYVGHHWHPRDYGLRRAVP